MFEEEMNKLNVVVGAIKKTQAVDEYDWRERDKMY